MPYLDDEAIADLLARGYPRTPAELNYLFSSGMNHYVENMGLSYQTINDIVGALEGAKQEFYRRVAAPYEDTKCEENGDVYGQE